MRHKKQFGAFLLAAFALLAGGCSDGNEDYDGPEEGDIWDIYPYAINIVVTDEAGNDLLDPEAEGSIADQGIKAILGEMVFEKDSLPFGPETKAVQVVFYGLRTVQLNDGRRALSLGSFNGSENREPTDFFLDWNDGTPRDTITFSHSFWWEDHLPQSQTRVWLNGEETEVPVHIIR